MLGLQLSVRVGGEEGGKSEIKEEGVEKHERGGGRADLGLFTVGREKGEPGCRVDIAVRGLQGFCEGSVTRRTLGR